MANTQITYNFPTAVKGDTYNDVEFEIKLNGVAQDLTDAVIRMNLVDNSVISPSKCYSTATGGIVITDAVNGKFKTNFGKITVAADSYKYDIEIKFIDGTVKTWIKGIFKVVQDYTI